MKLLLDQGASRIAGELLRRKGHDVVHVADVSMATASDERILELAVAGQRVIITWDADFHDRIVLSGGRGPSCMRIRIQGLDAQEQATLIDRVVTEFESELIEGAIVTVTESGTRARLLPVR